MHELDTISNSVDTLKKFGQVCRTSIPATRRLSLLNSAIDSDDGNAALREQALRQWRERLASIVRTGIKNREISSRAHSKRVAVRVISSLEGALMISRLNRDREALRVIQSHLEQYLDNEVRVHNT